MMQYGIKLSTKHPSESNNNFENSYFILIKIKIFRNQNNIGVKHFADIRFGMFLVQIDRQK